MGKYMRRAKTPADFPAMDVSPQSSFGVRTRAKTLALQRLHNPSPSPVDCFSFLQLRSRRLEKSPAAKPRDACKETVRSSPNPETKLKRSQSRMIELSRNSGAVNCGLLVSVSPRIAGVESDGSAVLRLPENGAAEVEVEAEASCGENMCEVEELNRKMRETTPSNLIRDSEHIETPGSSTRPSTNRRSSVYRSIPTTTEMEEFFAGAEQSQMKLFTEKYNYDPVNDRPLPGRYEWAKLE